MSLCSICPTTIVKKEDGSFECEVLNVSSDPTKQFGENVSCSSCESYCKEDSHCKAYQVKEDGSCFLWR